MFVLYCFVVYCGVLLYGSPMPHSRAPVALRNISHNLLCMSTTGLAIFRPEFKNHAFLNQCPSVSVKLVAFLLPIS
jgi:hypothetical protein